jgi:hypothetical protein
MSGRGEEEKGEVTAATDPGVPGPYSINTQNILIIRI